MSEPAIDWEKLREAAIAASRKAYAPYSKFFVGAAAQVDDGRVVSGCNVENGSYGLTLCAECGLVSALHLSGGGRLVAVVTVAFSDDGVERPGQPCGRCRQVLYEAGGPELLVNGAGGRTPLRITELLPHAWDLNEARSTQQNNAEA
jgi:cytidine deaminase